MTTIDHRDTESEFRYAEISMRWYGWGSPIGLGLFLLAIVGSIAMLRAVGLI